MLPGWSRDEILHETLVAPWSAPMGLPDTRIVQRPGWRQMITPSLPRGGFNEVSGAVLAESEADAVIDTTLAEYAGLGLRFRWTVTPESRPLDLGARLARRGLREALLRVMARPTATASASATATAPTMAAGAVTVEAVDAGNVDEFTAVMAAGWDADPAAFRAYHRGLVAGAGAQPPRGSISFFLGRVDGVAAASAGYIALARSAYFMGAVTLPPYRRRGLYQALIEARLRHAAARGLALATTLALEETSAPRLEQLGFITVARFAEYA
jgi:GNAT superfamily N-acetyltransferase